MVIFMVYNNYATSTYSHYNHNHFLFEDINYTRFSSLKKPTQYTRGSSIYTYIYEGHTQICVYEECLGIFKDKMVPFSGTHLAA